jgi:cell wall assembly regulator SMI1
MVSKHWQSIINYITSFGLSLSELGFRPGANIKEIEEAEILLDFKLPDDYREFLQLCNGQEFHRYNCFFHLLPTDLRFLGTNEIVELWTEQQKYVTDENIEEAWDWLQQNDTIRSVIFHQKRIPIADNEGVASLWLDYIPGPKGISGQLITNYTECDFVVLANTFTQLLQNYAQLIEKGILKYMSKQAGNGEGFRLHKPNIKCFEGDEMAKLFRDYCILDGNKPLDA